MCIRDRPTCVCSKFYGVIKLFYYALEMSLIFHTCISRFLHNTASVSINILPVSYTHLDVYKRQTNNSLHTSLHKA